MREAEASLQRLQTDYVDILYLHRDYNGMDLEEPLRALDDADARRQDPLLGRVQLPRLAHRRDRCAWRDSSACRGPVVCQPYYNLLNRMPEVEILPACAHYGIGVMPYSPIARGVLTGKYAPGQPPAEGTRAGRGDKRIGETEFREESLRDRAEAQGACEAQRRHAGPVRHRLGAGAIAPVSSVIAGPRTLAQWQDYLPALDYTRDGRGRGAGRFAGRARPSVHAGLQRSGLSAATAGCAAGLARVMKSQVQPAAGWCIPPTAGACARPAASRMAQCACKLAQAAPATATASCGSRARPRAAAARP